MASMPMTATVTERILAGIVGGETYGVVKDVSLYPVRILNCSASGTAAGGAAGSSGRSTITRALSRPP